MYRSVLIPTAAAAIALSASGASAQHPLLPAAFDDFNFIHALVVDDPESALFGFHHFYINDTGASALARGGPYPTGSIFLDLVYKLDDSGDLINEGTGAGFLMMTKNPEAATTGGWQFAQFNPDGSYVEQDTQTACFNCHIQAGSRDFVFSQPLDIPLPE